MTPGRRCGLATMRMAESFSRRRKGLGGLAAMARQACICSLVLLWCPTAAAYIDPGTGGQVFSSLGPLLGIIIAALLGCLVVARSHARAGAAFIWRHWVWFLLALLAIGAALGLVLWNRDSGSRVPAEQRPEPSGGAAPKAPAKLPATEREILDDFMARHDSASRAADPMRFFAPEEAPGLKRQKHVVGHWWRNCLVFTESRRVEKPLELREPSQLVLAVSAEFGSGAGADESAEFRLITLDRQGRRQCAYACEWVPGYPRQARWERVSVGLDPRADGPVGVSFEVTINTRGDKGPAVLVSEPRLQSLRKSSRPSILVYCIDALRRDYVGLYGCERGTTPFLDELAKECVVFEDAYAQSCWTKPSVGAMLTGLYPSQLGTCTLFDGLPSGALTLAEILRDAGYATAAFSTCDVITRPVFNFDQGYDLFVDEGHCHGDLPRADLLAWLDTQQPAPFFAYLHALDPHGAYCAPGSYRDRFVREYAGSLRSLDNLTPKALARMQPLGEPDAEFVRARYAGEVFYADAVLRRLVSDLKEGGLWDDLLVVILSDHGQEFGEHGQWGHRLDLYPESLRIPLLIKLPRGQLAGTRVAGLASHVDIVPTVLSAAGLPVPQGLAGIDLLREAAARGATSRGYHVAQFWEASMEPQPEPHCIVTSRQFAVVSAGSYYMRSEQSDGRAEERLFSLREDPEALCNVLMDRQQEAEALRKLAKECASVPAVAPDAKPAVDEETLRGLKALGYL